MNIGDVIEWVGEIPHGFLIANGEIVSRIDYPDLYTKFLYTPEALDYIVDKAYLRLPDFRNEPRHHGASVYIIKAKESINDKTYSH
jgi:hypothetical protein